MEYEWMDERALNLSLDLSVSLAKRFNVPVPCVISLRDVPGLPLTMVRLVNQYFSQYCPYKPMVTVGVNDGQKKILSNLNCSSCSLSSSGD
jgi:hypothetical protein